MVYFCRLYGFTSSWVNLTIPDSSVLSNLSRVVFLDTKTGLARYPVEGRCHSLGDQIFTILVSTPRNAPLIMGIDTQILKIRSPKLKILGKQNLICEVFFCSPFSSMTAHASRSDQYKAPDNYSRDT
jgi:hypothetical protein